MMGASDVFTGIAEDDLLKYALESGGAVLFTCG